MAGLTGMRIGIMGDTHGSSFSIQQAVAAADPVDFWLHTGDFYRDAMLLSAFTGLSVTAVAGNCDGRSEAKPDEFIEVEGYRIWLTHGHRYGVKSGLNELCDWARRYEADIVVFGHTHQAEILNEAGLLLLNPGSAAMPRQGKKRTIGVLELKPQRSGFQARLISVC